MLLPHTYRNPSQQSMTTIIDETDAKESEGTAFSDSQKTSQKSFKLTEIAIPIMIVHFVALTAFIPAFFSWVNVLVLAVGILIFGQGLNLGYHRLLAHRSLKVPQWLEYFYVLLALFSLQETPGKWVSTHRRHHNHSDEPDDPHSPTSGFFWSHMGWLLVERNGVAEFHADRKFSADILDDPFYAALEKNPLLSGLLYLLHAAAFYLVCWGIYLATGNTLGDAAFYAMATTWWGVFLRTVVVWHITWSVNSISHRLGYQNYETDEGSRNNWFVALLSSGEGWHNNHHHDPASASVQHRWWEIDLTYYHILVLKQLGLAKQVIKPRHVRQRESKENS